MEFIDAFAGIGGIRIGLERAAKELGIQTCCVKTIEWDKECQKTYKDNFESSDILGDITKVDKNTLPSHDVLLAGFPCQVFSRNGRFYNFYKGSEKRDPKFID